MSVASGSELPLKGFRHIGTATRGFGYEEGDPYGEFLPPAVEVNADGDGEFMRAVTSSARDLCSAYDAKSRQPL
jgi:hypothetical protein